MHYFLNAMNMYLSQTRFYKDNETAMKLRSYELEHIKLKWKLKDLIIREDKKLTTSEEFLKSHAED